MSASVFVTATCKEREHAACDCYVCGCECHDWTPMKRPPYNHTREDGPFDPCPQCLALMSREELLALVADIRDQSGRLARLTEAVTDALAELNTARDRLSDGSIPDIVVERAHDDVDGAICTLRAALPVQGDSDA